MKQMDLFEETLEKKILRMEKWVYRIQKELWFLKEVYSRTANSNPKDSKKMKIEQLNMFG